MSDHYIRCRLRWRHAENGGPVVEWTCVSVWDQPRLHGERIRTEMQRATHYTTLREAQRWARRYGVDCPTEPEPAR